MIIAVDFDGTLCKGAWPHISNARRNFIHKLIAKYLIRKQKQGHKLVLNTMREDFPLKTWDWLNEAVLYCAEEIGIVFDQVNENPEDMTELYGESRKVYGDIYIDDHNIGMLGWLLRTVGK